MGESILDSVKKVLGISPDDDSFDLDLVMHINSVFSILSQLGICSSNVYAIQDKNNTWNEVLSNSNHLNLVKTYVCMKVRLVFDPPATSSLLEALKESINEYECRTLYGICDMEHE